MCGIARAQLPAVATMREPVTNTYHGVTVVDEYQWLEDATNPAVREWTHQQNARTAAYFDRLDFRAGVAQELNELIADESASYGLSDCRNGVIFATRFKPPAQQPVLVRLKSLQPPALRQVIFDPNTWNTNGTTAMDWFVPATDGKYVAISLSEKGSENGTLHFFETATGHALSDTISGVQYPTAGGSAAWNADGSGIFYTRYPRPGERAADDEHFFQQIWFHKLGTPASADTYELGRDFPRIAEVKLTASDDGRQLLATVENGDGGDYALYLRDDTGIWHPLAAFADGLKGAQFGGDGALYLLSKKAALRGKILRLPVGDLKMADAKVVVPESRGVVVEYEPAAHGLYVTLMDGGPSRLWFYPSQGRAVEVPILPVSSVGGLHCWQGDALIFANSSFLKPAGWYEWQPGDKIPRATALQMSSPANFDDIEVVREFATSKDGTQIPISILRKKGLKLDGKNPTLLTGYGGYGINLTPGFSSARRLWFDAGGVYAVANLRGGGEFGEAWHLAGNLTRKQNVFDDFIACAEHLIQRKYTSPDKLAVMGGSNGGLLMGAFFTQRPDLARAVVSRVGIYDMLRVETDPNGAFNTTEFGSVADENQFKALYAYSPYHHVQDGTAYPAILFPCGENDGRVNPMHSRKMTARLQAATSSSRPILLRTSATAGHGMGSSLKDRVTEQADIYAFLFAELGVDTSPWTFK
ncbi:MAG TPA: prolyl oligopeptidase family serine peptidase [Verrucomicrobiae bacterium]|jgi:prolyl oligopeptidase